LCHLAAESQHGLCLHWGMDGRLFNNVVAWKFEVEMHLPDGRVFPRISYVKLPDRRAAAKALCNEYPMATFAIDQGQPLTKAALDNDLAGDSFLHGEVVRCLYSYSYQTPPVLPNGARRA
jgi:hypothetical protein